MHTYIFSLEDYFERTQKYYYFFDGMMTYEKKLKKDVLKEVDVYENSYRVERLRPLVKNANKKLLLDYFKYNATDPNSRLKYEICISKIYYCSYFLKLDILKELLLELELYIAENNYLKPLFILFKVFGTIPFYNDMEEVKGIFENEIKYLKAIIKTKYFTGELAYLYKVVLLHFDVDVNILELDEYSNIFRELRWFDYTIRANYYYFKDKDFDSLMYFNASLDEFNKAYNVERQLRSISNIGLAYNMLDKYQLSINVTEKVIKYAFSQEVSIWIRAIAMHYLFSNYMLRRYDEVLEFYNVIVLNENFLNQVSIIIIIVSAFKLGKMDLVSGLIERNKHLNNVRLFLTALERVELNEVVDLLNIEPVPYLIKIGSTL